MINLLEQHYAGHYLLLNLAPTAFRKFIMVGMWLCSQFIFLP
jgi:hypothetical protein